MRNRYLKILGLKPNAEEKQIKSAYRKLAKLYHPDVNNDPNSHQLFIKINEAYAKLINDDLVDEIPHYKEEFQKKHNRPISEEEFNKRMEWARNYAKVKSIKEERIVRISFIQIRKSFMYRFSKIVSIVSVSLATILLFDYAILKPTPSICTIKNRNFDPTNNMLNLVIQTPASGDVKFSLDQMDPNYHNFSIKRPLYFYTTPIFREKIGINNGQGEDFMVFNYKSFYVAFYFYAIALFMPFITLFSRGPNLIYILSVYFNTYLSLIIMFIFLLTLIFN